MTNKLLKLIPYIIIIALAYYLLPLFIVDTGSAMSVLLVLLPAITFLVSLITGVKHGINILFVITVALVFLPTIFIYYNETASIYVVGYFVISLLGNILGSLFYKKKK